MVEVLSGRLELTPCTSFLTVVGLKTASDTNDLRVCMVEAPSGKLELKPCISFLGSENTIGRYQLNVSMVQQAPSWRFSVIP